MLALDLEARDCTALPRMTSVCVGELSLVYVG